MIKYGMQGYGLYWYCLELICGEVDENNVSFELEHDAEIIAHETGINYQLVEEMMVFMVKQGLFEGNDGVITCMKLAKRLDQSMTSNPKMRELIKSLRVDGENHDSVMTESCKNRLDKTRLEENKTTMPTVVTVDDVISVPNCPHQDIINLYHEKCPTLRRVKIWSGEREKHLKARWRESEKHQSLEFWGKYFDYVAASDFLTGKTSAFTADLEWLVKPSNFIKVVEGKYDNRG